MALPPPMCFQMSKLFPFLMNTETNEDYGAIEQERLDAQAAAIVEMIGGVPFLAPSQRAMAVSRAVDVGCGTGVATMQLAAMFPHAKVYGLDISPVPKTALDMAPENTVWMVGNVLDMERDDGANDPASRDIFTAGGLDYIFGRMLFLGINDWARYFSIASHSLAPGGIIEHQDLDWEFYRAGSSECLSDKWEWHKTVIAAAAQSGLAVHSGSGAAALMKAAGLEVIDVQTFEFSFVPSSKTPNSQAMGRYVQKKLVPNYPELLRKMLGSSGIGWEELERMTAQCLLDIGSEEGLHQKYVVTLARKP
ncbi:hypothetical protein LOZ36_006505 [Ophidiomyces ophidiicola]|nr:hypothetical protein LOZ36_006505 [Ophidiomyces ophidiicola]